MTSYLNWNRPSRSLVWYSANPRIFVNTSYFTRPRASPARPSVCRAASPARPPGPGRHFHKCKWNFRCQLAIGSGGVPLSLPAEGAEGPLLPGQPRSGRARLGEPPCATRLAALRGCLTREVAVMTAGEKEINGQEPTGFEHGESCYLLSDQVCAHTHRAYPRGKAF